MTNTLGWLPEITARGTISVPTGTGKVAMIDPADIAAVAFAALTGDGHVGRTYRLTGPQSLSTAEIADRISRVIGKPVTHHDNTVREFLASGTEAGLPPAEVASLMGMTDATAAAYVPSDDLPLWERRFRGADLGPPSWGRRAANRVGYASNEGGSYQIYAHDLAGGSRRRVTDVAIGVLGCEVAPDGERIVWFDDTTGSEVGHWVAQPFLGGDVAPLVPGVPDGWSNGLALGERTVVVGVADDTGYAVYRASSRGEGDPTLLHASPDVVNVVDLDASERFVLLEHAEHGDSLHPALRVVDAESGEAVDELYDGPGLGLHGCAFSPVEGDLRVAFTSERTGRSRPGVWLPGGGRTDFELPDLAGDLVAHDWWPDGSGLLVVQTLDARDTVHRLDLATGRLEAPLLPAGSVTWTRVRPDGTVWVRHSSGASPVRVLSVGSAAGESPATEVLAPEGVRAPAAYPYESWEFQNADGERVHGFLVRPPGASAPCPTVMLVHGGPHWLWADGWRPEVAAWVDAGFAVAMVNYRGSTGYGPAWRDAIIGNPGLTELADLVAGLDDLVARGVTDPARVVLSGGSWGGYLTLLGLGRHPGRWAVGIAVVPVADYVAAYEDEAPELQSMDRVLFDSTPDEKPEQWALRSPLTYVGEVRAPVLIIAGDNDSRCPIRQVHNYVTALAERGAVHEAEIFDAGHGSLVADQRVAHMRSELAFVRRHLG